MTTPEPRSADVVAAWYVAHTTPRQERTAIEHLTRLGVFIYLPQLKDTKVTLSREELRLVA